MIKIDSLLEYRNKRLVPFESFAYHGNFHAEILHKCINVLRVYVNRDSMKLTSTYVLYWIEGSSNFSNY